MERRVRSTQRKMLRMIIGSGRRRLHEEEPESWVEWVKRVTHIAEEQLEKHNIDDWVTTYRKRKFMWAQELATNGQQTWAYKALMWQPDEITHRRRQARPKQRWIDNIVTLLTSKGIPEPWHIVAQSPGRWEQLVEDFIL